MLTLAERKMNEVVVLLRRQTCGRTLLTWMRKTGRAKLEGSPGGRESGSMEEERSRPAKQKICNQTKNNPIFSFSLAEPGASRLRGEM